MTGEPPARVVLVTGASSGIGMATALALAERGEHVALLARSEDPLDRVARSCQDAGAASVTVVRADVGRDEEVRWAVEAVVAENGRLDAVVHSAGVVAYGRTEEVPVDVVDGVLRTNVSGAFNVVRHVLPGMRARDRGTIVLVGSVIGHIAVPTMSPYVVSKWAVRALARQLQLENRDRDGIHIAYVAPGGVDTPIYLQGASTLGMVGRPPPPVDPPERVAAAILRLLDRPRAQTQVGYANGVIRLGFAALPRVYDRLVGVLFPIAALDRTTAPARTDGNVVEPNPDLEGLRGGQGSSLAGIAANLRRRRRTT